VQVVDVGRGVPRLVDGGESVISFAFFGRLLRDAYWVLGRYLTSLFEDGGCHGI